MEQIYLKLLKEFLSIPSISTQDDHKKDMADARRFLVDLFHKMDFSVKLLRGEVHEAVYAERITDKKLPTVLIYGHYDVQPPDPQDKWFTPPFNPKIKDNLIFARGANDNKGQIMIHLMTVLTLIRGSRSSLPVNFKFIIEGEEEIGSISVAKLAKEYGKSLFQTDYLIVSDSEMVREGQPAIDISLRGLVYTEVLIESAKQDLHSGQFGGVAENPANVLAYIISQLKDNFNVIKIPKFYDDIVPSTKEELKDYNSLKITATQIIKEGQLNGLGGGEDWYSLNERRWSRPTLDVNGIISGYTGEGSKTIIPSFAKAKISMRLVPNQDPKKIFKNFSKFVKLISPKSVKVTIINHSDALPFKSPTSHPVFNLVKQTLKDTFGKEAIFQGVGGSIGFVPIMAKTLKVPCIMVGFGLPEDNLHSPNEHFSLDNYYKGIQSMISFYSKLPEVNAP